MTGKIAQGQPSLRRTLSLPWLVFYGVGVTVGAGIFALIGEVLGAAGDQVVLAFLLAGIVAGLTGFSYILLANAYPRAAGEAFFVKLGLGSVMGKIVGYAVVVVAVTSAAVISLAFARYLASFTGLSESIGLIAVVAGLALIAMAGVKESVGFAAIVTILEVGTLLVVIAVGLPHLADGTAIARAFSPPVEFSGWSGIWTGGFLAFFAFIGFESIENMAEETHDAGRIVPLAIILTLVISVALYGLVSLVAMAFPDRAMLASSKAPLAALFQTATGRDGAPIAVMASIAMVNGILVQFIMASRVIYGMTRENLMPSWFGEVHATRQTPVRAIAIVAAATAILALTVPLLRLAELTSLVVLLIFAAVNASLVVIGGGKSATTRLKRWRWWGLPGATIALALIAAQLLA